MRTEKINYCCDDCKTAATFASKNKARKQGGWAIARDNKKCYCPSCAPEHRKGKAAEKNDEHADLLSDFKQLKII